MTRSPWSGGGGGASSQRRVRPNASRVVGRDPIYARRRPAETTAIRCKQHKRREGRTPSMLCTGTEVTYSGRRQPGGGRGGPPPCRNPNALDETERAPGVQTVPGTCLLGNRQPIPTTGAEGGSSSPQRPEPKGTQRTEPKGSPYECYPNGRGRRNPTARAEGVGQSEMASYDLSPGLAQESRHAGLNCLPKESGCNDQGAGPRVRTHRTPLPHSLRNPGNAAVSSCRAASYSPASRTPLPGVITV